ncbi:hypothetical protein PCANC_27762 [Puccinia coronata f. sp. avenae]|uniref:HCP-like protein n=1 Tax=Puccinia coronata f. sp. avenae TaxID=200324 RepID=A0A2N5RZB4_9BASI|nr:hypothetical protein PCANC_27762 [Puccinia coronata f. sp. avenae]
MAPQVKPLLIESPLDKLTRALTINTTAIVDPDTAHREQQHYHPQQPTRRPSIIGRVNSSTATTQTPRQLIASFYGDQELLRSSTGSHHSNNPHPQQQAQAQDRQSYATESDSEYDASSNRYASGHSMSSEDPFQYWQYEASRQSRDLLTSATPTAPVFSTTPLNTSKQAHNLTNPSLAQSGSRKSSTNFSRPIRPSSIQDFHDQILPTPPLSREMSPRNHYHHHHHHHHHHENPSSSAAEAEATGEETHQHARHHSTNGADTGDLLYTQTTMINSPREHQHGSSSGTIRKLGHPARSSIQSRSSIDTTSSTSSKRSWKRLFHMRTKSKDDDEPHQHNTPQSAGDEDYPNNHPNSSNLPSITFTQSQQERDIYAMTSQPHPQRAAQQQQQQQQYSHSAKEYNHQPMQEPQYVRHHPQVDVQSMGQPSYHHPHHDSLYPSHQRREARHTHNSLGHRLSIYSLPSCDDPTAEELEDKLRYASRSPLLFDTPGSSQLPSPTAAGEEGHFVAQQVKFMPGPHPSGRGQQQQGVGGGGGGSGTPLHSAIAKAKATLSKTGPSANAAKQTAQDYLQAGIVAHEQGDLERSAGLFERAAREGGGCGAGMLMWGLSLRHGWGCQVHEARAFKWLQKAAESVIDDLDASLLPSSSNIISKSPASASADQSKDDAAKSELTLAIYELGQCFMRGWGCKKDKQLAINYFELAAKLGDPDAQQELGFCYANGKGTKKDLKLAAKYYRMAAEQGVEMMGSQWIWKDKYN